MELEYLKKQFLKNKEYYFVFLSTLFFYLWDIGNPDALRQGTEGFYLMITEEMFNTSNYLTPTYLGNHHWSKPPLHFWFPMPLFFIFGGASLLLSRLSIAFISIFSIHLISRWCKVHFKTKYYKVFIFLTSSFAMLKYSKIFMMEGPLTLFTTLSSLYFYSYYKEKDPSNHTDLFLSSVCLGLSILIKGPVSLVMAVGGFCIYAIYLMIKKEKLNLKKFFLWVSLGTFIGSIWFFISYLSYGKEFFNYFFIRENLGKFTSKSYPITSVIKGLFIYSLPWCLLLPSVFSKIKQDVQEHKLTDKKKDILFFLASNFLAYFCIWLIPNQRSHHYAVPSTIFFLLFLYRNISINSKSFYFLRYFFAFIFMALIGVTILSVIFPQVYSEFSNIFSVMLTLLFLTIATILLLKANRMYKWSLGLLLGLGSVYSILIPVFILPTMPERVIKTIGNEKVSVVFHKPYFIKRAINKDVGVYDKRNIKSVIKTNDHYYIVYQDVYNESGLSKVSKIIDKWPIWVRGNNIKDFKRAFKARSLDSLQQNLYLLRSK